MKSSLRRNAAAVSFSSLIAALAIACHAGEAVVIGNMTPDGGVLVTEPEQEGGEVRVDAVGGNVPLGEPGGNVPLGEPGGNVRARRARRQRPRSASPAATSASASPAATSASASPAATSASASRGGLQMRSLTRRPSTPRSPMRPMRPVRSPIAPRTPTRRAPRSTSWSRTSARTRSTWEAGRASATGPIS